MSNFVDEADLNVTGGDGGAGCVSFRREAHTPRGGPDGGDGGRGGDVWLVADTNTASLLAFRDHPHRKADSGTHGKGKKRHGRSAADLEVSVPVGTVVYQHRSDVAVADLAEDSSRWLAARGGRGGKGNARFLSNSLRAPAFAEQGEIGETGWLSLELKLIADVALVGFPNAGKSTLISTVSAARPKIGDYPFTTLVPNLGVVSGHDSDYVVADIPGLIEGAASGRGLGTRFLRHIERSRALVVLIDLAPTAMATPSDQEATLLAELEAYDPDLASLPRIVVGSRSDVASQSVLVAFEGPVVSAVTGTGVAELKHRMAAMVERARRAAVAPRQMRVVHRPEPSGFSIEADGGELVVVGRDAERAVAAF